MNEPIKAGDECRVIGGALGPRSMNIGRRVIAMSRSGQELILRTANGFENFGYVWRCRSNDGTPFVRHDPGSHSDVPPDQADFAATWLEKADPAPPAMTTTTRELENS